MSGRKPWWHLLAASLPGHTRRSPPAGTQPGRGQSERGQPGGEQSGLLPHIADPWDAAQPELDRLAAKFAALLKEMKKAARQDGLEDDGPMVPTLHALHLCLATLQELTGTAAQVPRHYVAQIVAAIDASRTAATAETRRFQAQLEHIQADVVYRISDKIAESANHALARRMRVINRNSAIAAGAILVLTGAGCYWWGNSRAYQAIQSSEADAQAARSRLDDQTSSLKANQFEQAMLQCASEPGIVKGYRACDLVLNIRPVFRPAEADTQPAQPSNPTPAPPAEADPQPVPPLQPPPELPPEPRQTEQPEESDVLGPLAGFPPSRAKHIGHFGPYQGQ